MESEKRAKTTMLNSTVEYHENSLEESIMERNENDRLSSNKNRKGTSRAALSFMEVKSIVAASFGENERRCYKVHWKDSWIYEDHLFGCEDIIDEFWREQDKNEKEISMVNDTSLLSSVKKDINNQGSNSNTELTVIVVSKETEGEENEGTESSEQQNMIPDWLIGRLMFLSVIMFLLITTFFFKDLW